MGCEKGTAGQFICGPRCYRAQSLSVKILISADKLFYMLTSSDLLVVFFPLLRSCFSHFHKEVLLGAAAKKATQDFNWRIIINIYLGPCQGKNDLRSYGVMYKLSKKSTNWKILAINHSRASWRGLSRQLYHSNK